MSRVYNTQLGSKVVSDTTIGQKSDFVEQAILNANKNSVKYQIVNADTTITTELLTRVMAFYDGSYFFVPSAAGGFDFIFGEDTPTFAASIIELFGLTSAQPGITNVSGFRFMPNPAPYVPAADILIRTASSTFNNVVIQIDNSAAPIIVPSNSGILFSSAPAVGLYNQATLTITATDFTPGSEKILLTSSPA